MNVLYCSETWDLETCEMENDKLERWNSLHVEDILEDMV